MSNHIVKLGICQMAVTSNKALNISKAKAMIEAAAVAECQVAILPEMFNCPYVAELFSGYAESYPDGDTLNMLRQTAKEAKIVVVGGSLPERDEYNNVYNTSFIFDNDGVLLGRHRKMHLFDVDIKGGTVFKESSILTAGQEMTVVKTGGLALGVAICYDVRFPELSRIMTLAGAQLLIFPAVFGWTTGPVHWELLMRSRAVDNQVFVVGATPANSLDSQSQAYGHSIIVDPWGNILAMAGTEETMMTVEIDINMLDTVRQELPLLKHLRPDVYQKYYNK